ncbi:MAG: SDR family NAD(P)-dependent oxidoreductase [Firmicutes bacterium]|nr:SDR family NAD(P)-dependent oxidoreductase [Bacillota bacterium]MCM1401462.1 SDR family NAD(P)-dependent oxidoreductase [Bacteroides sp.]MCM1476820.1 SDR family NAD(P)-dependent oxidoreductase [Bacteroides sp.]
MKRIIIIGASSGLGERIALDFARYGFYVGIAARRESRLKAVKEKFPDKIEYLPIDVTADDAVSRFEKLIELNGGMDTLLYCSGTGFQDAELQDVNIHTTLDVNVTGFARITAAAYRYFRSTANLHRGQIAAITSVAGTRGIGIAAAYSASKRFQQQFLDSLEQLAYSQQVNVQFTDIRPGFVRTELLDPGKNYPMMMTVDYAAPLIEHAILTGRRRATIDSRWAILTALWRAVPRCLWKRINLVSLGKDADQLAEDASGATCPLT